jgi:hypothetical protein
MPGLLVRHSAFECHVTSALQFTQIQRITDLALYRFSDLPKPVDITVPTQMLQVISDLLPGWSIELWREKAQTEPVLRFAFKHRTFSVTGPWAPKPVSRADPVDAACGFIAELVRAYVNEMPNRLCLHAAAAEIGGRLVIFPSTHKAGKSVLSAALAAAGCRLSGDDIVLIDAQNGIGISGGLCPRLRLPLPGNLQPETRAFITANSGPTGKRYSYLTLDETALARKEERLPIGTFIVLERVDDGLARLEPIDRTEALKTVIWQNFARREPSTLILERLYGLVGNTGAFRLVYSRSEDAARLLRERFDTWPDGNGISGYSPSEQSAAPILHQPAPDRYASVSGFRRKSSVAELEIDGQRFLADNESGQISFLNQTASAIWHVLNEPMARDDIINLMTEAFPEIEPATIALDVQDSLKTMVASGLVLPPSE